MRTHPRGLYYEDDLLAAVAALIAAPMTAQEAPLTQPPVNNGSIQAVAVAPTSGYKLPAGTQVALKMAQEVTTKGMGWNEGDQFNLTVSAPVVLGNYVVIPRGTKGVGRIT